MFWLEICKKNMYLFKFLKGQTIFYAFDYLSQSFKIF